MGDGFGGAAEDADGLVADLVAVAVRAVEQVAAPPFGDTWDVGDLVAQSGGDQDAAGGQDLTVSETHREPRTSRLTGGDGADVRDGASEELAPVAGDLVPTLLEQGRGRGAVPARERTRAADSPAAPPPTTKTS